MSAVAESLHVDVRFERGAFSLRAAMHTDRSSLAIVGPSGAGKSSLLRVLAGVDRDAKGIVRKGTRTWQDAGVFVPAWERGTGWSPQDSLLFPHLTVRRNLAFGAVRDELQQVADLLDIAGLLDRRPARLSGGERQRVSLGRALLAARTLLLLDEPFSALDPGLRGAVAAGVAHYATEHGLQVVLVAHDTEVVSAIARERWLLVGGELRRDS